MGRVGLEENKKRVEVEAVGRDSKKLRVSNAMLMQSRCFTQVIFCLSVAGTGFNL